MIDPLPDDIFRKGQVLNNTYEIEGVLGRGGTGEVYRARNQITGRVVAVKALNRAFSANEAYIELMKREEEMRSISSDAVVRYTDCSRSAEGHVYLVMDYVDGTALSDWLERGGADPRDLLIVAHRVAEGLVATHARGIVHRDLSPDNIVLRGGDPAAGGHHRLRHRQGRQRRGADDRRQRLRRQVRVRRARADVRSRRAALRPLRARRLAARHLSRPGARRRPLPGRDHRPQAAAARHRGRARAAARADRRPDPARPGAPPAERRQHRHRRSRRC